LVLALVCTGVGCPARPEPGDDGDADAAAAPAKVGTGGSGGPFPWGSGFPAPDHFANDNDGIRNDGFQYTAPVGRFAPKALTTRPAICGSGPAGT
jgi:hypothetical protein